MDNTKEFQGWIYYIKNKVNGKMYVGKTNNFERRKMEHFHKEESCPILQRALAKYGKENFEMIPILTFKTTKLNVLNNILNQLEIFYIKKYNTFRSGYNVTKGGEGTSGYKHKEITKQKIGAVHKNKIVTLETKAKMSKSSHETQNWKYTEKPILLYNLQGKFIKEYPSITAAKIELTGKRDNTSIETALRNPSSQAFNYQWRYKETKEFPLQITPYINPRSKKVYYYSKENLLLGEFTSPKEAAMKTGIPLLRIRNSLNRQRKYPLASYFTYNKEGVLVPAGTSKIDGSGTIWDDSTTEDVYIAIPRESKRAATNSGSSVNAGSSGDNDIPE